MVIPQPFQSMKPHSILLFIVFFGATQTRNAIAQATVRPISDKKMVLFKAITTDSTEVSGFLKEFDASGASLYYYEPNGDSVARLSAEEVERIAYFKQGSFARGFVRGFLVAEGIWTLYVLTKEEGYFGRGFDWVVGTVLLVTPAATLVGILGGSRGLSLDYEVNGDAEKFILPAARLSKYSFGREAEVVITDRGAETLSSYELSEVPKARRDPYYSPRFHMGLQFGYGFPFFGNKAEGHYSPLRVAEWQREANRRVWSMNFSYSPDEKVELGYGYQFEYGDFAELSGQVNSYSVALAAYHYQSIHKFQGWYHIKPFYRAVGSRVQLSAGSALLLGNSYVMASVNGSSQNGEYFEVDETNGSQVVPGLGLMGKGAVFINPNFSFEVSLEQYLFSKVDVDPLQLEAPIDFSGAAFSVNPHLFSVNFGIRYHY